MNATFFIIEKIVVEQVTRQYTVIHNNRNKQ